MLHDEKGCMLVAQCAQMHVVKCARMYVVQCAGMYVAKCAQMYVAPCGKVKPVCQSLHTHNQLFQQTH